MSMDSPSPGLICKQPKFKISGFKYLRSDDRGRAGPWGVQEA